MRFLLAITILFLNISHPGLCAIENTEPEQTPETQLINNANDAFWKRDFACARNYCALLSKYPSAKTSKARILVNLAICDAQLNNWQLATKEANQGVDLACHEPLTQADGLLVLGRCFVIAKKIDDARGAYLESLGTATKILGDWNCDLAPIYEGFAACEFNDKNLPSTEKSYKKVAQLDYLKYGPDCTQLAWSLLSLCNVLEAEHQNDLAHALYKKVFWNFRHQNEERIISEAHLDEANKEAFVKELRSQLYGHNNGYNNRLQGLDYIKQDIPANVLADPQSRPHDFYNWFSDRVGRETAPGLAFYDPTTKLKALIVTIHGLGLHHGAFTPFAEKSNIMASV